VLPKTHKIVLVWLFIILLASNNYSQKKYLLIGIIRDSVSNEPISNAYVWIDETLRHTKSTINGKFEIELGLKNDTIYKLRISHLFYHSKIIKVNYKDLDSIYITIKLRKKVLSLGTVIVQGEKVRTNSNYIITDNTIKNLPSLGEPDLLRAVSFLPTVEQYNDFNLALHFRGGLSDQNRIIYDGMELYNPFHLYGILSAINLWTVDRVKVSTANFPVDLKGRLSGLVEIKSKFPDSKPITKLNLSLLGGNFVFSRKFEDTYILFGARRSYLDLILSLIGQKNFSYNLYDMNFKIYHKFHKNISVALSTLWSGEISNNLNPNEAYVSDKYFRGNKGLALNLNMANHNLFISFSNSNNEFTDNPFFLNNSINDFNIKYKYKYNGENVSGAFGFAFQNLLTKYNWLLNSDINRYALIDDIPDVFNQKSSLQTFSLFMESNIISFNKSILGLRNIILLSSNNKAIRFYPGIIFEYIPSAIYQVSISAERNYQFLNSGIIEEPNFNVINTPEFIMTTPSYSDIFNLGSKIHLGAGHNIMINFYYKTYRNIPKLYFSEHYPFFIKGYGSSYGFEFAVEKIKGNLTYQFVYVYQNTLYNFENKDKVPKWSFPHVLKGLIGLKLGRTWNFNLSFKIRSGPLYNKIIGYYKSVGLFGGDKEEQYDTGYLSDHIIFDKKKSRYKPYIKFDVSLRKKYKNKYFDWILYIQIQNITFNDNIIEIYPDKFAKDIIRVGKNQDSAYFPGIPFLPSVGVELIF